MVFESMVRPTKVEARIEKNRGKLGVFLLRKQGSKVRSGSIVEMKSKLFPAAKWCLLTSNPRKEIIMNDFSIEYFTSTYADLQSVKQHPLSDFAQSTDWYQTTAGLALIPVKPGRNHSNSILDKRRTFPTDYYDKSECRGDISCFIVGSYESKKDSFTVEEFTLITKKSAQGQLEYELQDVDGINIPIGEIEAKKPHLCPDGAVILKGIKERYATCIGVLSSSDCGKVAPVFFTPESLTGTLQLYYPLLSENNYKQQASARASGSSDGRNQVDGNLTGVEEETCLSKNSAALGYQIRNVDIAKDGNCSFHAVEDQLRILGQTDRTYKSLRALAVQELRVNLDENHLPIDLAAVLPNGDTATYLDNMSRDGEWGDQMVLVALSYALKRPIKVVTSCSVSNPEEAVQTINIGNSSASPILLGHLQKRCHYMSLEEQLSKQFDGGQGLGKASGEAYLSEGHSHSVVTGRRKHTPVRHPAAVPGPHGIESGKPSQNVDVTVRSGDSSSPQKEERLQNIHFLTTLFREEREENNQLQIQNNLLLRKSELDTQMIKLQSQQMSELHSNLRTTQEENEMLRAEKEKLVTENKELITNIGVALAEIKALISQRSAVFGDDSLSITGSNKVETEEPSGSSAISRQGVSNSSGDEEYVDALSELSSPGNSL